MIKINYQYLNRFSCTRCEYLYQIDKGMYLAFDKETLEYIGIELFYLPRDPNKPEKMANELLNKLISKSILEVI